MIPVVLDCNGRKGPGFGAGYIRCMPSSGLSTSGRQMYSEWDPSMRYCMYSVQIGTTPNLDLVGIVTNIDTHLSQAQVVEVT